MNWQQSLEIMVERHGNQRFRALCSDDNPNVVQRDAYRALMVSQADDSFPTLLEQAGNALGAVGRVATAVMHGEPVKVSPEERDRRWGLCMTCVNLVDDRCKLCGCHFRPKIELAPERCPIGKWERIE
jgi:hypothetical protein